MHAGGADGIRKAVGYVLLFMLMALWAREALAQEAAEEPADIADRVAFVIDVQGPIGPATRDFVSRSLETAAEEQAGLLIIRMDTPGGLDASTRDIVKDILNSPVPVATFVSPGGARAASAGTYILYASHVAAMSPATNVGAATPVAIIGGQQGPEKRGKGETEGQEDGDEAVPAGGDAMMRKAIKRTDYFRVFCRPCYTI